MSGLSSCPTGAATTASTLCATWSVTLGYALLFLVPGVGVTLRVNGTAEISDDDALRDSFAMGDKRPTTVIVVSATSVYTQCPKALIRSRLWDASRHRDPADLPSVGQLLERITAGAIDGAAHDAAYPGRIRETIY